MRFEIEFNNGETLVVDENNKDQKFNVSTNISDLYIKGYGKVNLDYASKIKRL